MSKTEDADGGESNVEQIENDTLIPIRMDTAGRVGSLTIGNDEETVTSSRTWTKYLVYATAESVMRCEAVRKQDRAVLATVLDSGLEFDSYTEEAQDRFGRPPVQIVVDEGEEAYDELLEVMKKNAYLHAAIKGVTVYDAAQELGRTPILPLVNDGEVVNTIGGSYGDPDLVSGAIEHDGEIVEQDLREFEPDMEFVLGNWAKLGGRRHDTANRSSPDRADAAQQLLDMTRDPSGETHKMMLHADGKNWTAHGIREVEESIVDDEEDRLRSYCGMLTKDQSSATVLDMELNSIDDRLMCSLCAKSIN